MATELATKTNLKKDKKSKRKSLGDVIAPVDADALLTISSSKHTKKRKEKDVTDEEISSENKRKKVGKAKSIVEVEDTREPSISAPHKLASTTEPKPSKKSKKSKTKQPSPPPEPVSDDNSVEGNNEFESGEDVHLHGFSTDDDDSSDEEDAMNFEPSAFDIGKLPTIAKDDATVKRKLEKAKRQPTDERGVLFLGRLPHGFYEDQMKAYFSQFGTVTRLRVSRNKKTGRSKHYGFLEFDSSSVAQIVADTMDSYLLMGHILRCKVIPSDEVHPELWVGANRKWRPVPLDRITRVEHNKPRTEDEQARAAKRLIKRQNDRIRKLADAGIKYDFEAVSYKKNKGVEV